ncbi:MAG: type I methionyl aminopeptidase [Anaerolineae bacterium]|nr:type I methionyl aminopeptidase [Anaerolineae bacterium]
MLKKQDQPRPVEIKSRKEQDLMRAAGKIVAEILSDLQERARPGVNTLELDTRARQILSKYGATSPFLGYPNAHPRGPKFPASICASVNEEIVHGIPRKKRVLREGDLLKIDVGADYAGYIGDSAWTFAIGNVGPKAQDLMRVTEESLRVGIEKAVAGGRLWDMIAPIQMCVETHGFNVVREYQGHGVGRDMHEEPSIPNFLDDEFDKRPSNIQFKPGMTFAIEPMVVTGTWETRVLGDQWTVITADHGLAAHYEHTVLVTENGPEILTAWK